MIYTLFQIVRDSETHFLLAFLAGFAAFLLIVTTSFGVLSPLRLHFRWPASQVMAIRRFILGLGLLCALCAGFASHVWLDSFTKTVNKPLGAPILIVDSSKGIVPTPDGKHLQIDLHSPLDPYPDNALTPTPTDVPADWNKP